MLRIVLYTLLFYFLYRFIFEFLIPVGKTAGQVRKKVKEMQEQQEAFLRQQEQYQQQTARPQAQPQPKKAGGDYIEFEEVKDWSLKAKGLGRKAYERKLIFCFWILPFFDLSYLTAKTQCR